ncbi:MAG: Dam family site-specific DNA-(adenine-N6)-methyltransferase [Acidobacteria bacterium]|nr:Dam family site-specific DNA-(adenine-N6)-methyltransferase [Acidobacteriota bacterium]
MTTASSAARPFLKWAGGKRQLLPQLRRFYPQRFGAYHEPFLGSGAVFFDLVSVGSLRRGAASLTDVNADLVGCWLRLRDDPDAVIAELRQLDAGYREAPDTHYYRVRDELFNPGRAAVWNGGAPAAERYTPALAAMFIYLNRTGFNGLFRLNSKGKFNVPRGRYPNPRICDAENLRRVADALSAAAARVAHRPYAAVFEDAHSGDFIYLDPPYAPLSATARFTGYTPVGFGSGDQQRLQQVVVALAARGCHVLLSNSTAPEIAALYDGSAEAERVGIRAYTVPARRAINSNAGRRGAVPEYIITNIPARAGCP